MTVATGQKSEKHVVLTKFWVWQWAIATPFCHKKNRWNFVEIRSISDYNNCLATKSQRNSNETFLVAKRVATCGQQNPNEILTKSQRYVFKPKLVIPNLLQMTNYHARTTYQYIINTNYLICFCCYLARIQPSPVSLNHIQCFDLSPQHIQQWNKATHPKQRHKDQELTTTPLCCRVYPKF